MSSRHNTYDRYGHGQQHQQQHQQPHQQQHQQQHQQPHQQQHQQQHKRPRDDSERDPRGGPRQSPDLRDALVRDSRRQNDYSPAASPSALPFRPPYSPAASPSAPPFRPPNSVDAVMTARGDAAVEWEILNGVLVKDENFRLVHIPVSLRPVPFPRSIFNIVWDIQALLQQLYVSVSRDHEFLCQSLTPVLVDDFTCKLWGIYCRVREKVGSSQPMLAVTRSDYMLSRAPAGGPVVAGIKQIEFNSLSVGGLPWTSKVASMHSYLSNRYPHAIDGFSPVQSHPSHALSEVAQAIGAAFNSYCLKHGIEPKHACVLHIQGHSKYAHNVTDQEGVEVEAVTSMHVNWVKKTFGDLVYDKIQLQQNGCLKIASPLGQLEVAVVYYRCGWSPDDYRKPEMFAARETLELSTAIKCPNIAFHLTGLKKMQESLAQPGALERFVSAADADRLRNVFEEMHPAADAATGKLERVREHPQDWVLKPQREGGGNNIFGEEAVQALKNWPINKLKEYVIMRRIDCPAVPTFCVRKSQASSVHAVSELGIYGVYFSSDSEVALNKAVGYLVRSKEAHLNEAGILHGGGFVDSLRLVDDAVWAAQVVNPSSASSGQSLRQVSLASPSPSVTLAPPLSSPFVAGTAPAPALLPPSVSSTLTADSVAVSELARSLALAAARDVFHSDLNFILLNFPMSCSATGTLFASLLGIFTSTKRGPTVEGLWWTPLLHSCSLDGGALLFEEHMLQTLNAHVLDRLILHFELNEVWKAKQSSSWCVYVKRCLRILQQLHILDESCSFADLNHTDANGWEEIQLMVKQKAPTALSSIVTSVVSCFHRAIVGQAAPPAAIGSELLAERRDTGLWAIAVQGSSSPAVEIHDSRLQRMWAAFSLNCASSPVASKFFEAAYACVLRYDSTIHCASGRYSHHYGIPSGRLPSLLRGAAASRGGTSAMSRWIDCFSSPMTMLELAFDDARHSGAQPCAPSQSHAPYYSPYADTDSCFGSRGSFFDADYQKLAAAGVALFFHPPNDLFILERVSNILQQLFVHQKNDCVAICVFPSTKCLLKTQESFQSAAVWQPATAPVFCSGHSRDGIAVTRLSDCDYRVLSVTHVGELHVASKPLLSSLVETFNAASASMTPPAITQRNSQQYLTHLESDKGQAMLRSAFRDSAMYHKYSALARGFVEQGHNAFCCPASVITIINSYRPEVEKLLLKDFFTPETEVVVPQDVISCSGVTLECLPKLMRCHGLVDCSLTLASSRAPSEFRAIAISSLKNPSSFIVVNFSRRALNQKGWGHYSPLAAYDVTSDSFLVLDVEAASHTKFWVSCDVLHAAMVGSIADGSGRSRGWVQGNVN